MDKNERLTSRLLPEMDEFKHSQQTLLVASINAENQPNVSYAPYALADGGFYILISDIAKHGQNLKHHRAISVMMIEDEQEAKSIYARKRLTFDVEATLIERDHPDFIVGTDALVARFGEIAENLRSLSDFNLYQLRPHKGLFVKGFGKAFEITGEDLTSIHWLQGNAHKKIADDAE